MWTRRYKGAAAPILLAAALLAGCSGSSSTKNTARIRGVDAAVNAGTVSVLVNNGSTNGSLNFLDVSDYLFVEPKDNIRFSYATSATVPANTSVKNTLATLTKDQFYTAFLIGRADLPAKDTGDKDKDGKPIYANDPRFLQIVVAPARVTPPSGQASIRVLNAAPELPFVTVRLQGDNPKTDFPFFDPDYTSTPAFRTLSVPPRVYQVNIFTPNSGNNSVVPATTITPEPNKSYTLIVTEQLSGTPAVPVYGVKVLED